MGRKAGNYIGVKAIKAEPATRSDIEWYALGRQEEKNAVESCRQSGRVVLQIVSFLVPAYTACLLALFKDIGFDKIPALLLAPLWFWLIALILSFLVLLPWPWHAVEDPDEIKAVFKNMAQRKWYVVCGSGLCVIVGMIATIVGTSTL